MATVLELEEPAEHRLVRESVRAIAESFGHGYFAQLGRTGQPPTELWQVLSEHGFIGAGIPERYGGGGAGLLGLTVVEEELSAAGLPLLKLLVSPAVAGAIIARHGTEEQRARWLPPLAAGTGRFALAVTEADAGSNTHRIATRSRQTGGGYVISGSKTYISGLEDSEWILALTRAQDVEGRAPLSLFVIDVDDPRVRRQPIPTAPQAPEQQWTLFFDDVEVDEDRLIGSHGGGLGAAFDGLNPERIMSAALCLGVGRYALAKASAYARERAVWGQPIGAHQGVAHPLAEVRAQLEAAWLLMRRAAALHDAGAPAGESANMAKLLAADIGCLALDRAIQVHGGNGLADEYGLADLWFIVRLMRIAPVSREMILNYIAQHSLGLPRSY